MSRRALAASLGIALLLPAVASAAPAAAPQAPATEPDPVGAHAAIAQAQERLAEMDATVTVLQDDADGLDAATRQKAHDAVTALRTMRDTYKHEIDGVAAQARQMTADQLRTARAALDAPYRQFEGALDADVAGFKLDAAHRKAIVEARLKAEAAYWHGVAADLKTTAANLTAEQRAAIDARLAAVDARAANAEARLGRLATAGRTAWSALKQGFISSGHILGDALSSGR